MTRRLWITWTDLQGLYEDSSLATLYHVFLVVGVQKNMVQLGFIQGPGSASI